MSYFGAINVLFFLRGKQHIVSRCEFAFVNSSIHISGGELKQPPGIFNIRVLNFNTDFFVLLNHENYKKNPYFL